MLGGTPRLLSRPETQLSEDLHQALEEEDEERNGEELLTPLQQEVERIHVSTVTDLCQHLKEGP